MSRSARLLDLLAALRRRRRPVAAALLAEEPVVSPRTVQRDVATLVAQGAPIEGEPGPGYVLDRFHPGWRQAEPSPGLVRPAIHALDVSTEDDRGRKPGSFLPPLAFGENEADTLILGLRWVAERGDAASARAADGALAKIAAVLPREAEEAAGTGGPPAESGASPHLAAVHRAMRAEETLRLRYTDKKGAETERTVWPVALGHFGEAEVLAPWCETRRDFRHFRLDRIATAAPSGRRCPKRRRVLLAEWGLQQDPDLFG